MRESNDRIHVGVHRVRQPLNTATLQLTLCRSLLGSGAPADRVLDPLNSAIEALDELDRVLQQFERDLIEPNGDERA